MPKLGAHVQGGVKANLSDAEELKAETIQIFTHNPGSWFVNVPKYEDLTLFREKAKKLNINPIISHCGYLINLATTDNNVFKQSLELMKKEVELCHIYGAKYLVVHVGKHKGNGVESGINQVAKALNSLKDVLSKFKEVTILLETTAGQGTELGSNFSELNEIIKRVDPSLKNRVGVCIDTCHIFSAGYDIRAEEGIKKTFEEIKKTFGFNKIKCIHINDSKGELNSRLDRHENIGNGKIGYDGLKRFLTKKEFDNLPMILETNESEKYNHKTDIKLLRKMFSHN